MYQSTVSSSVITLLALLPVTDLEHANIQYFQPLVKLFSSSIPWLTFQDITFIIPRGVVTNTILKFHTTSNLQCVNKFSL